MLARAKTWFGFSDKNKQTHASTNTNLGLYCE